MAEGSAPPVQAKTKGLKELFSTLIMRISNLNMLSCSFYETSLMFHGHEDASWLKTSTSQKVLEKRVSQSPFALMSSQASSVLVVLCRKDSRRGD